MYFRLPVSSSHSTFLLSFFLSFPPSLRERHSLTLRLWQSAGYKTSFQFFLKPNSALESRKGEKLGDFRVALSGVLSSTPFIFAALRPSSSPCAPSELRNVDHNELVFVYAIHRSARVRQTARKREREKAKGTVNAASILVGTEKKKKKKRKFCEVFICRAK